MDDVVRAFGRHVAETPHERWLFDSERELTYEQADAVTDLIVHRLTEAGARPGDSVAWIGGGGLDRFLHGFAAQKGGFVQLWPEIGLPDAQIRQILDLAEARHALVEPGHEDRAARLGLPQAMLCPRSAVRADVPRLAPRRFDGELNSGFSITSGSTGLPKIIQRSRAINGHYFRLTVALAKLSRTDVSAILGQPWTVNTYPNLISGGAMGFFDLPRLGAAGLVDWLAETRTTVLMCYPAMFRQVLAAGRVLPDLRLVLLIGEPVSRRDAEAFTRIARQGAELINVIGSMECTLQTAFTYRAGDPVTFEAMPLGREIDPGTLRLIGPDGDDVPDGATGEIVYVSRHAPRAYLGRPDLTAERIATLPDGRRMFRTGDLARRDFEGVFHSMGRSDFQTKIRGYTVRLNEIEAMIEACDGVEEAVITAPVDGHGIRRLVCHHVGEAAPESLRAALAERLPNYMIPSVWRRCAAMPRTTTGKVLRAGLPDPYAGGDDHAGDWADETEARIAALFRSFLGDQPFGRDDDFFDLGGDSLQAMALTMELENAFRTRVPLENLMLHGASVAALAQAVAAPPADDLMLLKQGGAWPPLVCIHTMNGNLSGYLPLAHAADPRRPVWGLRGAGDGGADRRIETMARRAVDRLLRAGRTPEAIVGYSYGGPIAREVAALLLERTGAPTPLILIDPHAPWVAKPSYLTRLRGAWRRYDVPTFLAKLRAFGLAWLGLRGGAARATYYFAARRYEPRTATPVPTLLICADDEGGLMRRDAWAPRLGDDLRIEEIGGDHVSIMREPRVGVTMNRIESWLAERRAPLSGLQHAAE